MNVCELARALGFGENIEGFRTWSDELLDSVADRDQVPPGTEKILRDARRAEDLLTGIFTD